MTITPEDLQGISRHRVQKVQILLIGEILPDLGQVNNAPVREMPIQSRRHTRLVLEVPEMTGQLWHVPARPLLRPF